MQVGFMSIDAATPFPEKNVPSNNKQAGPPSVPKDAVR